MKAKQNVRADGSGNIIVQAVDSTVIVQGQPYLVLIPPRCRKPQTRTEIDLLNPYCRAIEMVGREADMESLYGWLHSPRPVSVRTLTGRGGAGKTRIAIELIENLDARWWAGFVTGRELRRFAAQQNLANWSWARPTLVVVDYAASQVEPLRDWLRELAQHADRTEVQPFRLLLIEREADTGEGWLEFLYKGGWSEAKVRELFDPLEPQRLTVLDSPEKRRKVLTRMIEVAAPLVGCQPPKTPDPGQNPRFDRQLEDSIWEDPLYLMMAALLSLQSDLVEVLDLPRKELALRLVDHEIKRLTDGATAREVEQLLVHLAAFASLGGGLTHEQALAVAEEESAALKFHYPCGAGALVSRLHDLLPAPDRGIAPLVPDIFAGALVLRALGKCNSKQQEAAVLRAVKNLGMAVIPFIIRMAQDFASAGETAPLDWVETLVKAGRADDLGLLLVIERAMPYRTLALREKAVEVNELLADRLGHLAQKNPTELILAAHALLLNNLSVRLSALGRREEALAKAQEAVRIYEQLAKAWPDAFLPDLATSLNNLANRLSDLGRREEALAKAQEGLRIREQLAKAQPDAFLPDLARSLHNLAAALGDLGRREEALAKAQEAVRVHEQLTKARPDAFLPALASSLTTLAAILSRLGRHEDALAKAQEAVRIYEQLAKAHPHAFEPELAMSLNNLANCLSDLGRREEALAKAHEAVGIYEQLAKAWPAAFLPELARSYGTRGMILTGMGQHREAADSFARGIRALTPWFQKTLTAFADLMRTLCGAYFQAIQQAGVEPDPALLAPVHEIFERLKQQPAEE